MFRYRRPAPIAMRCEAGNGGGRGGRERISGRERGRPDGERRGDVRARLRVRAVCVQPPALRVAVRPVVALVPPLASAPCAPAPLATNHTKMPRSLVTTTTTLPPLPPPLVSLIITIQYTKAFNYRPIDSILLTSAAS
jgi:hypothetical protein